MKIITGKKDIFTIPIYLASAIEKLQQIEDKYYYSLDLNAYLNDLEDDAYEA